MKILAQKNLLRAENGKTGMGRLPMASNHILLNLILTQGWFMRIRRPLFVVSFET